MKRCPTCNRVFDDDLQFCLEDGSSLVAELAGPVALPTLTLPANAPGPTIKQAFAPQFASLPDDSSIAAKPRRWPWFLGVGLFLVVVVGLVGALILLRPRPLPWHLVLETQADPADRAAAVQKTVDVIKARLNSAGVPNFQVLGQDNGRILVNLPALQDPERLKNLISNQGKLEFVHVVAPPSPMLVQTYSTKEEATASLGASGITPATRRVLPYHERAEIAGVQNSVKWVIVESPAIINSSDLRNAVATASRVGADYEIDFSLRADGAQRFGEWTGANINEYIGVVLNDEVKSIAFIRGQIFDQGQITGHYTKQSAEDLAAVLRTGALPAPVKLVDETVDKP